MARQLGAVGLRAGALGAQAGHRRTGQAGELARGSNRNLGAGRTAWARRLAKGCALDALNLFLARFDSVFFLSRIFGHCS